MFWVKADVELLDDGSVALVVDVANTPKSPLLPPAVLPAFAGRMRYEGAGGSVRSWTLVFGPMESSTTEVTPGVRMMVPPASRSKLCISTEASGVPPTPLKLSGCPLAMSWR